MLNSIYEPIDPISKQTYLALVQANRQRLSFKTRRNELEKITNEQVLKVGPTICYYCLEVLFSDEAKLLPETLFLMIESENLLWNALLGFIPTENIKDETSMHKIWYKEGKESRALRQKIGAAMLFFWPYGDRYSLKSAHSLLPEIKGFMSNSQLRHVTDRELEGFIGLYNKRIGKEDCFILNYPMYVDKAGLIKPMMLTPQEISQKHQEITSHFNQAIEEAQTIQDCMDLRQWLTEREENDYYIPGVNSTIVMFKKRIQERISYLENSAHEEQERKRKNEEQIILDGLLNRLKEAMIKTELLQLRDEAKKILSSARGSLYRDQLSSVISRIEAKIAELDRGYDYKKLPFVEGKPGLQNKNLEGVLKAFYEFAWMRIQTREYGIPDNCRIAVTPNVLKDFSHVLLNEKASKFLCKVFTSDGSSFELDLYSKQPTTSLVLLLVFVVANIADIVKGREITPDLTVDSHNRRNIRLAEPSSPGKRDTHQTERKYPTQHLYFGVPTGEGTPHSVRTNCQVVWHFRNIGQKKYSQKALANALKFTGVAHIPKGFTFVRPHPRNAEFGDDFEPVVVETELAASLSKTLDLYFKNL